MTVGHDLMQQGVAEIDARWSSGGHAHRRASAGDLCSRRGGGRFCVVGTGQTTGRAEGQDRGRVPSDTGYAFGHETALPKASGQIAEAAPGGRAGASRTAPEDSGASRLGSRTSRGWLSGLRKSAEAMRADSYSIYRRHSGSPAGSNRTYHPSRLVSEVPE